MSPSPEDGNRPSDPLLPAGAVDFEATLVDPTASAPGSVHPSGPREPRHMIGQYRVLQRIGEGGMGTVFEAEQENPRRKVALKIIRPGLTTRTLIRRFELEAQVLGRLQHPGIAQIYEAGAADTGSGPQPFFAMEYVRGGTLLEHARHHDLGTRQRIELMTKICEAVHYAHQQGIIHRDLKPGNILVDTAGQPKVLDFGVARATDADLQLSTLQTDAGQLIGTLAYMSPEQVCADRDELDIRSDVYALGMITYELLAGALPYSISNKSIPEALRVIREDEPARLSSMNRVFRGDIETIVSKTLEKDKSQRYRSAAELGDDLHRYLTDQPIIARPPTTLYQLRKFAKRNKALVLGVFGVFLTLLGGIIISTAHYYKAEAARATAVLARDAAQHERDRSRVAEQKAEESFRLAREAVDRYLNRIAESPELKAHGLEDLRRGLLATARTFYEQFVRQRADDPTLRRDLASAHLSLGNISRIVGESDEAERAYRRALDIVRSLAQDSEARPEDIAQLSNLEGNLGLLYSEVGQFKEAEDSFQRARELELGLGRGSPEDPEHRARLSNLLNNLGVLYETTRRTELAETVYQQAIDIREELAANHPKDPEFANNLIASYNNLAKVFATTGRASRAEPYLKRATEQAETLARAFPQSAEYQNSLAASYGNLAGVYILTGRMNEAALTYERSLPLREGLAARHPSVLNYRLLLSSTYCNLGELNLRMNQPDPAVPWFEKALGALNRVLEQEPRHTTARYYISYTHSWRAQAFEHLGRYDRALSDWDDAIAFDDNKDPQLREGRSRVLKQLDR